MCVLVDRVDANPSLSASSTITSHTQNPTSEKRRQCRGQARPCCHFSGELQQLIGGNGNSGTKRASPADPTHAACVGVCTCARSPGAGSEDDTVRWKSFAFPLEGAVFLLDERSSVQTSTACTCASGRTVRVANGARYACQQVGGELRKDVGLVSHEVHYCPARTVSSTHQSPCIELEKAGTAQSCS